MGPIVGYTFKAENRCGQHTLDQVHLDGRFDGWRNVGKPMPADDDLQEIAVAFGFDLDMPWTFDSDDFPKPFDHLDLGGEEFVCPDCISGRS